MIRPYQEADRSALLAIMQQHIPEFFDPAELKDFDQYLQSELEDYFVVEEDGRVLAGGGINYLSNTKRARISWDMVHSDHVGKGIGGKLLEHRIDLIRQQGSFESIDVRTSQLAIDFYHRFGFQMIAEESDYWGTGIDLKHLLLPL